MITFVGMYGSAHNIATHDMVLTWWDELGGWLVSDVIIVAQSSWIMANFC